jgi:hypothetical protein
MKDNDKEVVELEEGSGWAIVDVDDPQRPVPDRFIEDIQVLSVSDVKVKNYDDGVTVEVVEFIEGDGVGISKVKFKGL